MKGKFDNIKTLYFLGAGGIGMSALARYFNLEGKKVYGYDLHRTPLTKALEKEGIHLHYEEDPALIPPETDLVIYTPAIPEENRELRALRKSRIPMMKRAEVLGMLSSGYKTVAVAGTHGKTSITALTTHLLASAGKPVIAFIGGIALNFKSNFVHRRGASVMVVEADEYDRSMLKLHPFYSLISSVSEDHLDIYKDIDDLRNTFGQFANQTDPDGAVVLNEKVTLPGISCKNILRYGTEGTSDAFADNIEVVKGNFTFRMHLPGSLPEHITMTIPGMHYVQNALGAALLAYRLGLTPQEIKKGLESFKGVERRFNFRIKEKEHIYIDDYAHHPEEIEATLKAARKLFPGKRMTVVFQPHLYSRTRDFADEFGKALSLADSIILLPVYPAREKPIKGITSRFLLGKISNDDKKLLQKDELYAELKKSKPELLITLGAGDIGLMADKIEKIINGL